MMASVVLFSLMGVAVKSLREIPLSQVVFFRAVISLALGYVQIRGLGISPWGNQKRALVVRGLIGTTGLFCYFYTLQHLAFAEAVTIQYLSPIFSAIVAIAFLREEATAWQWFFLLGGFFGVWLMKGAIPASTGFALWIGLIGAVSSAFAYSLVRKIARRDHPYVIVFYFPLVTLPIVAPFAYAQWVTPTAWQWAGLVSVGLFTHFGQIFMTRAYQLDKITSTTQLNYLQIVFATVLGAVIFHEIIAPRTIVGIILIVAASLLSTLPWVKGRRRPVRGAAA